VTSGQNTTRKELIIGKWETNYEGSPNRMTLNFKNDSIVVIDKSINNGKLVLVDSFTYSFNNEERYLYLNPLNKGQKAWNVGIIEINNQILNLRSQSPDSSILSLRRIKE
jgi:hypothetical protein